MKNIYWSIYAFDRNRERRTIDSPHFSKRKDAELWKMQYIIDHPNDYIMFELMNENGQRFVNDIGSVVTVIWTGDEDE